MGIISLFFAWFFYRISLELHVKNGTFFQSLFDLYRDKLEKIQLTAKAKLLDQGWGDAWSYLKHGLIKCNKCGESYPDCEEKCPHCKN